MPTIYCHFRLDFLSVMNYLIQRFIHTYAATYAPKPLISGEKVFLMYSLSPGLIMICTREDSIRIDEVIAFTALPKVGVKNSN